MGYFPIDTYGSCISKISFRVRCGSTSAGSDSCVALPVKEDFADEEDYIKAGGSELLFVQMQQNKHMDQQSKFSDKVSFFLFFVSFTFVSFMFIFLRKLQIFQLRILYKKSFH